MKNVFHDSKISFWIKKSLSLSMLLFVMLISALESNAVVAPAIYPRFAYVANYGNNTISMYRVDSTTGQFHYNGYVSAGTGPISVTVDPTLRFVYAANSGSNNISVYVIDQTNGTLTAGTAVPAGTSPYSVSVDPTGRFVYATNYTSHNVSVYTINQTTGALTATGAPVGAGTNPRSISVDPSGEFAYVANTGFDNVFVYSIDQATGELTATGLLVGAGNFPVSVDVDPTGKFAYVANYSSNNVSVYTINQATGELTAGTAVAAGTGPRSVTVDPTGRFAYVANSGTNNISVYTINQTTGALTAGTAVAAGTGLESITIDPTGNFAYAANDSSGNIYAYSIDQITGALTPTGIVHALNNPLSIAITTGVTAQPYLPKFAYATNYNSNNISVYTINQTTGALTAGTAVAAGTGTHFVAVDPTGRFAYVANNLSHSVSAYTINQNTGALIPVETETAGIYTYSVAIDPTGRFLYAPKAQSTKVYIYTIDQNTGALTSAGSVATGNWPVFVTIDPSGRYAYVANEGSKNVSVYTINQSTEVLNFVETTNTGTVSYSLTVDPKGRFLYVPNYNTDNVTAYSINQTTGVLTPLDTVAAGDSPFSVTIGPKGNVAYVINYDSNTVSIYTINESTGLLTPAGSIATGTNPHSFTIDATGKFAYAANWTSNDVSVYTINQTTGELTSAGTAAAGTAPSAITTAGSFITSSASLKADYQFQNNLTSSAGSPPPLDTIGGGSNTFVSDVVRGVSTSVLEFPQHNGLSLSSASAIIPGNVYTIAALFSFDSISGYRRIVDFEDGSSDNGLYNYDGKLVFYKSSVVWSAAATMSAGSYSQVVITRDAAKNVIGYVNGAQQFSFADSSDEAVISANDRLKFFRDNTSGSNTGEASPGAVSRIRIYDYVLSAAEVLALEPVPVTYDVTITRIGLGGGAMTGSGTFNSGETVTVAAYPDTGSIFSSWGGDCSGLSNPGTLLIDGNKNCTADFSMAPVNAVCGSANGQTLSAVPTSGLCNAGTATLVSGTGPWTWTCSGIYGGTNASCSASAQTYSITVSKSGTGSGTVTGAGTYNNGQTVTVSATADSSSVFSGWSGDCSGNVSPTTVLVNGIKTCTAAFTLKTYTITPGAGPEGKLLCTHTTVNHGSSTTCIITPFPGYQVEDVKVNGVSADRSEPKHRITIFLGDIFNQSYLAIEGTGDGKLEIYNIGSDCTITASFTIKKYNLTTTKTGSGTVTVSPPGISCGTDCFSYNKNQRVTVSAKTEKDNIFTGWSGECSGTGICMVTMDADTNIGANFVAAAPVISVTPDGPHDFGNVRIGRLKTKTLKITNNGTGNLRITSIEIDGTDSGMFSKRSGTAIIKPGKSSNLKIMFKPKATGQKTATLIINSNDPNHPVIETQLGGTGKLK